MEYWQHRAMQAESRLREILFLLRLPVEQMEGEVDASAAIHAIARLTVLADECLELRKQKGFWTREMEGK